MWDKEEEKKVWPTRKVQKIENKNKTKKVVFSQTLTFDKAILQGLHASIAVIRRTTSFHISNPPIMVLNFATNFIVCEYIINWFS